MSAVDEEYERTLELSGQLLEQVMAYSGLDIPATHKIDKILTNVRRTLALLGQLEFKSGDEGDEGEEEGDEGPEERDRPDFEAFEDEHDILWNRLSAELRDGLSLRS